MAAVPSFSDAFVVGIIQRLCNDFYQLLPEPKPMDRGDLQSEAYLAYAAARKAFDQAQSVKFQTYFYQTLRNRLTGLVQDGYSNREFATEETSQISDASSQQATDLHIDLQSMTNDQKHYCSLIMDGSTKEEARNAVGWTRAEMLKNTERIKRIIGENNQ